MFDDLLIHTIQVFPRSGRKDRFGQPVDVNPRSRTADDVELTSYACRAWLKAGGLTMMERSIDVFEKVFRVYVQPTAEIYEDDAVRIVDEHGRLICTYGKLKDVNPKYAMSYLQHIECDVWVQSGPNPERV